MRAYEQRMAAADCANGHHAYVVSTEGHDEEGYVEVDRVCLVCRGTTSHLVTHDLFMGIKTEHLWMAPDVRLGT